MEILLIEKIKNNNVGLGYIGIDLITKEKKYFTNYDKNGIYFFNKLFEFDIKNPPSYIQEKLKKGELETTYFSKKLAFDIKYWINDLIIKHFKYNQKKEYPISNQTTNLKTLTFRYNNPPLFDGIYGNYQSIYNIIHLNVTNQKWLSMNDNDKKIAQSILLHELGHMKVANIKYDKINQRLKVQVGFYKYTVLLNSRKYQNEDNFYTISNIIPNYSNKEELILEELINEVECLEIDKDFKITYPNYGNTLNYLCDNKLKEARYKNGIDTYLLYMTSLIKSENNALEILREINLLSNKKTKENQEKVNELLKPYIKRKLK